MYGVLPRVVYELLGRLGDRFGHRLAHGHELFRRGRVDADRRIEHSLGGARLQRNGDPLQYLAGIGADHMYPEHPVSLLVDDHLHHRRPS